MFLHFILLLSLWVSHAQRWETTKDPSILLIDGPRDSRDCCSPIVTHARCFTVSQSHDVHSFMFTLDVHSFMFNKQVHTQCSTSCFPNVHTRKVSNRLFYLPTFNEWERVSRTQIFFSYSMGNEFVDTIYVHMFHTHICQSHPYTLLTRLSMGKVKSTTSPCFFYCFFSYVFLTSPHRESLFLFTFHISKKWQTCWQKQKWKSTHFFSLFIFIVVIRIKVFLFSLHET